MAISLCAQNILKIDGQETQIEFISRMETIAHLKRENNKKSFNLLSALFALKYPRNWSEGFLS